MSEKLSTADRARLALAGSDAAVDNDAPTATIRRGDGTWHDGVGWYYTIDDYPDEGSCGAFRTSREAADHARACGYDTDTAPREPGCECHWEVGDSPCPVHGDSDE